MNVNEIKMALQQLPAHELAELLAKRGDIRVACQLAQPLLDPRPPEEPGYVVVLDTEGTVTNELTAELLELGMLKVLYCRKTNRLCKIVGRFNALRDPGIPIPAEATKVNHITDEMVRGQSIDFDAAADFVSDADWVIAHNAKYDRPMCERYCSTFSGKAWACSYSEVPWADAGIRSGKLEYIAFSMGFFYEGHRAIVDCEALLHALAHLLQTGQTETTPFELLMQAAGRSEFRVYAFGSPFDRKDMLKERGYRWHDGLTGPDKAWYCSVADTEALQQEFAWLRESVYARRSFSPGVVTLDAFSRFSRFLPEVRREYL